MSEETDDGAVYNSAREYANLKHDEKSIEAKRKAQGKETLELLQGTGTSKVKVDFDKNFDATVAIKKRENTTIDQDKLKKALGARVFNKLTTPMLDDAKIEAAIRLGDIDPNVVSSCMETTETPYLEARFTKKRKR